MGRLATNIAAALASADNLPPKEKLPSVSFLDVLLPSRCISLVSQGSPQQEKEKERKPLDPNIGRRTMVTYYGIKKDKAGKRSVVAHRTPVGSVHGSVKVEDKEKAGSDKKDSFKASEEQEGGEAGDKGRKKGEKKKVEGGDKKPEEMTWTAEEDAQLRVFKAENNSWKNIAAEMGKQVFQLKARWKEIEHVPVEVTGAAKGEEASKETGEGKKGKSKGDGDGDGGKGKGKDGGADDKKAKAEKAKQVGQEKKQENKKKQEAVEEKAKPTTAPAAPPAKPASTHSTTKTNPPARSEAKFTLEEWRTLQEDALFSFDELQLLSDLIMHDHTQTWLRIAARFYDKTGRRVHPEDIREKFEELGRMG